ncbi:bombyxin A-7-like isoform X2 [Anticarsia gemmatalis]
MSLQKSFALLLLCVAVCCAHEQKYCGRSLARAIAALCFETGDPVDKRNDGTMYNSILAPYYRDQEPSYGWAWPPHKARGMSLAQRGKRLIVNECCDKACTVDELLSYCNY